jgi:hypothetical protein
MKIEQFSKQWTKKFPKEPVTRSHKILTSDEAVPTTKSLLPFLCPNK